MLFNLILVYVISAVTCLFITIDDCIKTKGSLWTSDLAGSIVVSLFPIMNTLMVFDWLVLYIFKDRCLFKQK